MNVRVNSGSVKKKSALISKEVNHLFIIFIIFTILKSTKFDSGTYFKNK